MTAIIHQHQRNGQSRAWAFARLGRPAHSPAARDKAQDRSGDASRSGFSSSQGSQTGRGFGPGILSSFTNRTRRPLLTRVWSPGALSLPVGASGLKFGGQRRVNRSLAMRHVVNTKLGHHVRQDTADVPKSHRPFSVAGCCREQPNERGLGRVPNQQAELPQKRGAFRHVCHG